MNIRSISIATAVVANFVFLPSAFAQTDFEDMTSAQKLEARNVAAKMHMEEIKFCADGGNLPFSNLKGEGFENKIAEILANAVGAQLTYYWRPSLERGATRAVFDNSVCDVLIDIPANWEGALTTLPLYSTTYVLAYRSDKGITPFKSLDDPELKKLRVGVYETSALREALAKRGLTKVDVHPVTYDGDLNVKDQPWWQVQQVADGDLDVAAVWGPFAGYVKAKRGAPLTIQPVNRMDDTIPLEFNLALGVRSTDAVLKYMLDDAMQKHRDEIKKVLEDYGVPLVECGSCIISGDIPAHGTYFTPEIHLTKPTDTTTGEAPHVADATVNQWLKDGLDLNSALNGAVVDSDLERIRYLVSKGADVNSRDGLGQNLIHIAAEQRDMDVISELLDDGANIEARDGDGWTPLMHAASSDNVPAIRLLIGRKAKVDATTADGYTALAYALADGHFAAAQALVDAGASVSKPVGPEKLTPLMITASQLPPRNRTMALVEGVTPLDMARLLVTHGASVNDKSSAGMTALMVAAVHNNPTIIGILAQLGADLSAKETGGRTARELAVANDNQAAAQILDVLAATSPKSKRSDPTAGAEGKTL
ncbi:MAG: quinoprotein dehydrogenase-associated putative ABC transporter substrate-binding protein [Methylovirgula sp.]|uniref:quinoprotein dehydrogenase-associated putative ABC transporter substrate-binding protein n=1 Tax=Methylovirgula sp. TaxID=1978224 RepID=UPI003075F5CA